ncbi:LppU/SCO3897 family protein [Streptomyces sp. NPDC002851]
MSAQQQRRSPLHSLLSVLIVVAIFGGVAWYVWDYNTNPNGGKAKEEAAEAARLKEEEKKAINRGDCVKVKDAYGDNPAPTKVDCGSPDAQFKAGEMLYGPDKKCGAPYDYGIQYSSSRGGDYTQCYTKL